jgi:hypothetical protein
VLLADDLVESAGAEPGGEWGAPGEAFVDRGAEEVGHRPIVRR